MQLVDGINNHNRKGKVMPASPISKKMTLPDNWVQLQKTMIPDSETSSYWSVWYDVQERPTPIMEKGTAWLMWCPIDDDPSINDHWGHAEEINEECRNVLTAIESVYGVSFHDSIWVEMGAEETFPAR